MNKMSKYFKPSVIALESYSSATDEYDGQDGIFLDANENGFDFEYRRYPDPYQKDLKKVIGTLRKIDPRSIFIGNGSDEIIDLLIRATCVKDKDRILSLNPSYGMYKVSSCINEIPMDLINLNDDFSVNEEHLFEKLSDRHKLVFICSPNNPNGGIIDPALIEKVLKVCSGLVVVDEAYIDFSETTSWLEKLAEYKNLIILQTFSKSLGAAGIRLGMAFMNAELITFLNKIKPPYNISIPNQDAAIARLKKIDKVQLAIQNIVIQRGKVKDALEAMSIVDHIFPSSANFLLVKFSDARLVFERLKSKKIIVRDRSQQVNCEGCLRITISTENENSILLKALKDIDQELTSEI